MCVCAGMDMSVLVQKRVVSTSLYVCRACSLAEEEGWGEYI